MRRIILFLILSLALATNAMAADSEVSALTTGTVDKDDLIYIVDDPSGTPLSRSVDVEAMFAVMSTTQMTNTGDIIYETELDTFSEAQSQIADKTLINTADSATITGAYDFSGSSGLVIPYAASPTVDTDGDIAIDSTEGQLLYDAGSGIVALSGTMGISFTIENLAAADDNFGFWIPPVDATLISAKGTCQGTCTTEADISFEISSTSSTLNVTGSVDTEDISTGDTYTTLSGTTNISAGDLLRFDVDNAVDPETDKYTFSIKYKLQRK